MAALEKDVVGSANGQLNHHLGEIVAIDRSVGALREGLRKLKVEQDTLVWYCSDNGGLTIDPDSCGKLRGNKGDLFEGGIRVPGIVEWPGRIKPAVTSVPATTMDIFPTIVDLLDLPDDSLLPVHDGESIVALLDGGSLDRAASIPFYFQGKAALIDGDFKLLTNTRRKNESWQLYNLQKDPSEKKNLADKLPVRFRRMKAQAEAAIVSIEASALGKDYAEGKVIQPPRDEFWFKMKQYQPYFDLFFQRAEYSKYAGKVPETLRAR